MNEQLSIRMFALKHNLNHLKWAYEQTRRDAYTDVGIDINQTYKANEWYYKKIKEYRMLVKQREYTLFTYIFNFTQCCYALKEYLKKLYPEQRQLVEDFFSNSDTQNMARKDIANDLKHNPESDVQYDFREYNSESYIDDVGRQVHASYMKNSWFYKDVETIEYCTRLHDELKKFIEDIINDSSISNS